MGTLKCFSLFWLHMSQGHFNAITPLHYEFLHVVQLRDLKMEVESMLSETPPLGVFVRSTGWYFKTSGFALRCVNSLSSLLSDHFTQLFLLCFRGHHCANSNLLTVCLSLLPFRSNLTSFIVYRSAYILKFSLWLPSIVQLHCAGYNYSPSPTFFGRLLQPWGGGRGGGNGVRGAQRLSVPQCEDLSSRAIKLPLSQLPQKRRLIFICGGLSGWLKKGS